MPERDRLLLLLLSRGNEQRMRILVKQMVLRRQLMRRRVVLGLGLGRRLQLLRVRDRRMLML